MVLVWGRDIIPYLQPDLCIIIDGLGQIPRLVLNPNADESRCIHVNTRIFVHPSQFDVPSQTQLAVIERFQSIESISTFSEKIIAVVVDDHAREGARTLRFSATHFCVSVF